MRPISRDFITAPVGSTRVHADPVIDLASIPNLPGALCAESDPDAWFPEGGQPGIAAVRVICAACPVAAPCLEWALEHYEQGIWSGTTRHQRQEIRRQRARDAGAAV